MSLLTFLTLEDAQAANQKVFKYLVANEDAKGSQWAEIVYDETAPRPYAFLVPDDIASIFQPSEITPDKIVPDTDPKLSNFEPLPSGLDGSATQAEITPN